MAQDAITLYTPVGHLVQGSVLEGRDKDREGKPFTIKTGPNAGQATTKYFLSVAFPKTSAEFGTLYGQLAQIARQAFPNCFNAQGQCTHPRFAWKIVDGDGVDQYGKPNSQKPGFAGCWVLRFETQIPPRAVHNGQIITDPNYIKRGYYVRVMFTAKPNVGDIPGLFISQVGVELVAYGTEIQSGPDVLAGFQQAGAVGALPAGASLTPPTPTTPMPGMGQPGPGAMPGMQPMAGPGGGAMQPQPLSMPGAGQPGMLPIMPGAQPAAMPGAPNANFVPNALGTAGQPAPMAQPMPGAMPGMQPMTQPAAMPGPGAMPGGMPGMGLPQPAALQPVYQMTAAANGMTREQCHAQGYNDDVLMQHGWMVRVS